MSLLYLEFSVTLGNYIVVTFGNDFCDFWQYDCGMVYYWVYLGLWLGVYAPITI